jgi:hypothetical protein
MFKRHIYFITCRFFSRENAKNFVSRCIDNLIEKRVMNKPKRRTTPEFTTRSAKELGTTGSRVASPFRPAIAQSRASTRMKTTVDIGLSAIKDDCVALLPDLPCHEQDQQRGALPSGLGDRANGAKPPVHKGIPGSVNFESLSRAPIS